MLEARLGADEKATPANHTLSCPIAFNVQVSGDQHRAHFRPGHDLRIPVPMYEIMPRPVLQLEVPPPRRELLFFWGGASRHRGANIRRDLWKYQSNTTGFYVPISTFGTGRNAIPNAQTASVSFDYWMQRSVFCGSPPGYPPKAPAPAPAPTSVHAPTSAPVSAHTSIPTSTPTRILCPSDCRNDIARAGGTAATAIATCPRSCTAARHC